MKLLVLVTALVSFNASAHAATWSASDVARFHKEVAMSDSQIKEVSKNENQKVILPISPGYNQGMSGLCWLYATLNTLETNYLAKGTTKSIAISRAATQYMTMEDRYINKIRGIQDYISDAGAVVDAIDLFRKFGAVELADYRQNLVYPGDLKLVGATADEQINNLRQSLDQAYGAMPATTHSIVNPQAQVPILDLGRELTGTDTWAAYGSMEITHRQAGVQKHWDSDARPNTKAEFVPAAQLATIVKTSLLRNHAVAVSWCGHSEEIYGAEYDSSGNPVRYLVKGSYGSPGNLASFIYSVSGADLPKRACGLHAIKI